jgi:hypothetical protein
MSVPIWIHSHPVAQAGALNGVSQSPMLAGGNSMMIESYIMLDNKLHPKNTAIFETGHGGHRPALLPKRLR